MPKKLDQTLLDILTKYGERPEDALWDCHGTWVAYHKAIERIAARAGVVFDMPQIIEASTASKTVAIAVRGALGDRAEWSFGEAAPANNKNAYPYAMAEKRAKDRVVLKLIGLHGLVFSEEESDDFKPAFEGKPVEQTPPTRSSASLKRTDENGEDAWDRLTKQLYQDFNDCHSLVALSRLRAGYREKAKADRWPKQWLEALANEFDTFENNLMNQMDASELSEVPLKDALKVSIRDLPTQAQNLAVG